jgi:hypothetical protein
MFNLKTGKVLAFGLRDADNGFVLEYAKIFWEYYTESLCRLWIIARGEQLHPLADKIKQIVTEAELFNEANKWTERKKSGKVKINIEEAVFIHIIFCLMLEIFDTDLHDSFVNLDGLDAAERQDSLNVIKYLYTGVVESTKIDEHAEYHYKKNHFEKVFQPNKK